MRAGVRIGVDVGNVRVGVARTDPTPSLALPLQTLTRDNGDDWGSVALNIERIVLEYSAIEVIVGLPLNLKGAETASTQSALACAERIAQTIHPIPVRVVDERLSTVSAAGALRESGIDARRNRKMIDQQAAVIILQHAIDTERLSGSPAGRQV